MLYLLYKAYLYDRIYKQVILCILMKKRLGVLFLLLLIVNFGSALVDSDGDGYLDINNCIELQSMNNSLSSNYELMKDIDCSATVGWAGGAGFKPIGYCEGGICRDTYPIPSTAFLGNFNGRGYIVSGLVINLPSMNNTGMFGYTAGNISNVGLTNINISGYNFVGGLVGFLDYRGFVSNSSSAGIVNGSAVVGGLIGKVRAISGVSIFNSYSAANVNGFNNVGGLIGLAVCDVSNSYSVGNVTGCSYVGGLAGYTLNANIFNSYSRTNVTGIDCSYSSSGYTGGLVGYLHGGSINKAYSAGKVTGNGGGLVGGTNGVVNFSYWDITISGKTTSAGGVGKSSTEMKIEGTFIGWNFRDWWYPAVWVIDLNKNNGYPYLGQSYYNLGSSGVYTHRGENAYLYFNTQNTNLQFGIAGNIFTGAFSGGIYSPQIIFGHSDNEIVVNVGGNVKMLRASINDGSLKGAARGNSPSIYNNYNLIHGEYASNISIIVNGSTMSLQDLIDSGYFSQGSVCTPNCIGKTCGDNGCGGSCGSCTSGRTCSASGTCLLNNQPLGVYNNYQASPSNKYEIDSVTCNNLQSGTVSQMKTKITTYINSHNYTCNSNQDCLSGNCATITNNPSNVYGVKVCCPSGYAACASLTIFAPSLCGGGSCANPYCVTPSCAFLYDDCGGW